MVPLHCVSCVEVARLLLSAGADIDARTASGQSVHEMVEDFPDILGLLESWHEGTAIEECGTLMLCCLVVDAQRRGLLQVWAAEAASVCRSHADDGLPGRQDVGTH